MGLSREERLARRKANRRSQRMAGEVFNEDGTDEDIAARADGFRNANDRRLGTEEYDRLSGEGMQDADSRGRYSAKEVIAEMRHGRGDRTTEEMAEYYQGLADDGAKFNQRAQDYLGKHGVTFGGGGGGGNDPIEDEDPIVDVPDTPDVPEWPFPDPPTTGIPTPVVPTPGNPGGQSMDNWVMDNDNFVVQGPGSINQQHIDNSVSQQSGGYSAANEWTNRWMKDYDFTKV